MPAELKRGKSKMGEVDIRYYLSILLRRLPYFLVFTVGLTAVGIAVAYVLPPVYRASAKILIETPQIPSELARSTVPTNSIEQLQIIEQEITTREHLLALATKLKVYGDAVLPGMEADIVDDMRSRVRFERLRLDTGSDGKGATVFSISFEGRDPALSADVVNNLVDVVLSKNFSLRSDSAGDTKQFFEREVGRLNAQLVELEAKILKFKNANATALPNSLEFRRNQQKSLQERLVLLEREESSLRTRRNSLVQIFESTGQLVSSGTMSLEQQMLQEANRALSEQLAIFAEDSPSIVALRTRIATLQGRVKSDAATDTPSGKGPPSELELQLADIDDRLHFIAEERTSIGKSISDLTASIAATPGNETILTALERNRLNIQAQYNANTARLAEALTGQQIETGAKGGKFSVVEPAIPPQQPVSPNRRRIAGMGLAGGVGLGLGWIVLLELLNKTVRRPVELTRFLQSQPLATIPYIWADDERQRARRRLFLTLLCIIAACLVGLFVFDRHVASLGSIFEKIFASADRNPLV